MWVLVLLMCLCCYHLYVVVAEVVVFKTAVEYNLLDVGGLKG